MFHSILHPPARIILKIHKSDYIIPFLRTFQWLPIRMKPKVLIKAFTAKGLLSATLPLSPTALPPSNTSAKYILLNSLSSPNIFPPQAFELAVPFVWKVHFLRPPSKFLPVTEVSVQASSLQRHSPFHPICSGHPPLSVHCLVTHAISFVVSIAPTALSQRRQWQPTPVLLPGKSHGRRSLVTAVHGVAKSRTRLSHFTFTFYFLASEKEMATHSCVLAWRIPGMGEPGGLPSVGSHRVGHD